MTITKKIISTLFGSAFLMLSLLIVLETLLRKIFNVSLQGVDELSGYVLAFGAALGFASALLSGNHMRIDLFYRTFPVDLKVVFNVLSVISLTVLAGFLTYISFQVLMETRVYGSTAATPWATPLIIPQGFWLAGTVIFAAIAILQSVQLIKLLLSRDMAAINSQFGPKGAKEEVATEISNLQARNTEIERVKKNALMMGREVNV